MDPTREQLWGQLILERNLVAQADLSRLVGERDAYLRQGRDCSLASLLIHYQRIDQAGAQTMGRELEVRGRACPRCQRIYLASHPQEPYQCQACGGPTMLPPTAAAAAPDGSSGRWAAPGLVNSHPGGSSAYLRPTSAPPQGFGPASGQHPAVMSPHASAYGSYGGGSPMGSSRITPAGSGRWTPTPNYPGLPSPSGGYSPLDPGSDGLAGSLASMHWRAPRSTPSSPEQDIQIDSGDNLGAGKRFGRYEILQEIGRGGMGVVYKVRDPGRPEPLALKVLLAGEFASPKLLQRFRDEARLSASLRHPNIVAVHDVGEVDGIPYYAMDFIPGGELQDLIRNKNLSVRRGVEILVDVARAAHHAHEAGVIHRDLKPSNVLVAEDGRPYIMDFGLAKQLDEDKGLTRSGVAIGTPYYMPPEQARGQHREMDNRSDIYAMGAILYEILTRKVPFTAKTQNELLRKICEEEPPPPRQVRASVPLDLQNVALKALEKEKDRRYETALELADDLGRFLAGMPVLARPPSMWVKLMRKARRNKRVAAAIGAAGLAIVLALGAVVYLAVSYQSSIAQKEQEQAQKDKEREEQEQQEKEQREREEQEKQRQAKRRDEADDNVNQALLALSNARTAADTEAARAQLENALRLLDKAVSTYTDELQQPNFTAHYWRGIALRALCRWAQAEEDFRKAAREPSLQARARLAQGLVALRSRLDYAAASAAFQGAKRAENAELDRSARDEEQAAAKIAAGYLSALSDDPSRARRDIKDAEGARGVIEMAPEIQGALAFVAALHGAPMGGDQHADLGIEPSRRAEQAEPFRFGFLVDRATLLARRGRPADLDESLKLVKRCRTLDANSPAPELAEAVVRARQNDRRRLAEATRAARVKAQEKGTTAKQAVERALTALQAALRQAPPSPPGGGTNTASSGAGGDSGGFVTPDGRNVVTGDSEAEIDFGGGSGQIRLTVRVPKTVAAVRLQLMDIDANLAIYVKRGGLPRNPNDVEKRATDVGEVALTLRQDDAKYPLTPGDYGVVIESRKAGKGTFVSTFYEQGEALPHVWNDLDEFGVIPFRGGASTAQKFTALQQRVRTDPEGAMAEAKRLEQGEAPLVKLFRLLWLQQLKRHDEVKALGEEILAAEPDHPFPLRVMGVSAQEQGKLPEAAAHFRRITQAHPNVIQGHKLLLACLGQAQRWEPLLAHCRQLSAKDPALTGPVVLAAEAELRLGRKPQALKRLVELLERKQRLPRQQLVQALEMLNQNGGAAEVLKRIDALAQRYGATLIAFEFARVDALTATGQKTEAIQRLESLLGRVQGNSQAATLLRQKLTELKGS